MNTISHEATKAPRERLPSISLACPDARRESLHSLGGLVALCENPPALLLAHDEEPQPESFEHGGELREPALGVHASESSQARLPRASNNRING